MISDDPILEYLLSQHEDSIEFAEERRVFYVAITRAKLSTTIYYRKDKNDDDILIKVLLNGQESRLPVKTDCAPYYNWQEVKRYYLRKLYAHEKLRFNKKNMNEESN